MAPVLTGDGDAVSDDGDGVSDDADGVFYEADTLLQYEFVRFSTETWI